MLKNRILPIYTALLFLLSFEIFLARPRLIYAALAVIILGIVLSARKMANGSMIDKRWWNFIILPILFSSGLIAYATLLPYKTAFVMQGLFFLGSLFIYFYMRSAYYHLVLPTAERRMSFENISWFGNFLTFFFIASSIYGFESFLNMPIWPFCLIILAVVFLLVYQMFLASRIDPKSRGIYILVSCFVITELAWAMFYLPFNFNVTGAILAVDYYVLTGVLKVYLNNGLSKAIIERYLAYGFFILFIILITARWL